MSKKSILLVGVGGYGRTYVDLLLNHLDREEYPVAGVVDPFVQKCPLYGRIQEEQIPCYDTMEAFYGEHEALLAVLATPIHLHAGQVMEAMEHGSHVLCEKPLVPRLQDLDAIRQTMARTGKQLSVGFQWCFSDVILKVKRAILAGEYGRALCLRSFTAWPRNFVYYSRSWAGKYRARDGSYILDSIVSNGIAHYLHNMLFLLGDRLNTSAPLVSMDAGTYRANTIDTYDTVAFSGKTAQGVPVHFYGTHACNFSIDPTLVYEFEKATVTYNLFAPKDQIVVHYRDGRVEQLGSPNDSKESGKLLGTLGQILGKNPAYCGLDTIVPHLACFDALSDFVPVLDFPQELVVDTGEQRYVKNLHWDLWRCFEQGKLPSQMGIAWAQPEVAVDLTGYTAFQGRLMEESLEKRKV